MMGSVFLSDDDMAKLTGRKRRAAQVAALKAMAVPFRVNAAGWPVVPVSAVDGIFRQPEKVKTGWQSDKVIDGKRQSRAGAATAHARKANKQR